MTRRITLGLASDTSETHCGACSSHDWFTRVDEPTTNVCGAFGVDLPVEDVSMGPPFRASRIMGIRLPECLAAEQEHVALTRDAESWRRIVAILPRPLCGPETQAELLQDIANMTEEFINPGGTKRSHVGRILDAIAAELRGDHG
jgi:hypothetical protein